MRLQISDERAQQILAESAQFADVPTPPVHLSRPQMLAKLTELGIGHDTNVGIRALGGNSVWDGQGGRFRLAAEAPAGAGPIGAVTGLGRAPDVGDTVARRMSARRGRSLSTSNTDRSEVVSLDAYRAKSEQLGPRSPTTGLRPTQDLGDAVAERMAERRTGRHE